MTQMFYGDGKRELLWLFLCSLPLPLTLKQANKPFTFTHIHLHSHSYIHTLTHTHSHLFKCIFVGLFLLLGTTQNALLIKLIAANAKLKSLT